jgi:hypothetical protein
VLSCRATACYVWRILKGKCKRYSGEKVTRNELLYADPQRRKSPRGGDAVVVVEKCERRIEGRVDDGRRE